MNLKIENSTFIVCGATSGFGLAITRQLIAEGANIIAVARTEEKLKELEDAFPGKVKTFQGDITQSKTIKDLFRFTESIKLGGILVNAGGPPAMKFLETSMKEWDDAYQKILRWKVELTQLFLPRFMSQQYGRILYIESSAVKQPIENLVLSTSMRLSVVGMVKTLSQEMPDKGITFNVLAPGYHNTPAIDRLIDKQIKDRNISKKEATRQLEQAIPLHKIGSAENFASLAVWLLSPLSDYVTGQVFTVDGGVVKGTL
jgi:3-oxoacyl-[acyl-carrier protein] reductase